MSLICSTFYISVNNESNTLFDSLPFLILHWPCNTVEEKQGHLSPPLKSCKIVFYETDKNKFGIGLQPESLALLWQHSLWLWYFLIIIQMQSLFIMSLVLIFSEGKCSKSYRLYVIKTHNFYHSKSLFCIIAKLWAK